MTLMTKMSATKFYFSRLNVKIIQKSRRPAQKNIFYQQNSKIRHHDNEDDDAGEDSDDAPKKKKKSKKKVILLFFSWNFIIFNAIWLFWPRICTISTQFCQNNRAVQKRRTLMRRSILTVSPRKRRRSPRRRYYHFLWTFYVFLFKTIKITSI